MTSKTFLPIQGNLLEFLICGTLLVAGETGYSAPNNFGPYVVKGTLPTPFVNLSGLTFANGSLYALSLEHKIRQLNPATGQSLMSWSVDSLGNGDDQTTGLAWDGNSFWMASYGTQNNNHIRGLSLGASSTAIVTVDYGLPLTPSPSVNWPMDLTFANNSLMYPQYTGPIREFSTTTGQMTGSLPTPSDLVYGLTFDGESLLAAHPFNGTIWRISAQTGAVLDTWQTGVLQIMALAYDVTSEKLFIGTASSGIVVMQAPEPGSLAIGLVGMFFLAFGRFRSRQE